MKQMLKVLKSVVWSEIELPSEWLLENENIPTKMENTAFDLNYLQQYLRCQIKF